MSQKFNESNENFDTFTKMYHKVLKSNKITFLQKHLISDVISFQIQGLPYMRTSKNLGEMLGGIKKETISKNFQTLAKKGFVITKPSSFENNENQYDLRLVEVVNIEQWIYNDVYLDSISYEAKELTPLDPEKSKWIQTKINSKKGKTKKEVISIKEETKINIDESSTDSFIAIPNPIEVAVESKESQPSIQLSIFDELQERGLEEYIIIDIPKITKESDSNEHQIDDEEDTSELINNINQSVDDTSNIDYFKDDINVKTKVENDEMITINYEEINNHSNILDAVRDEIKKGKVVKFFDVKVDFLDDEEPTIDNVCLVNDRNYPKLKYARKYMIENKY